ncbi:HalOD1 output domain-containing protein [Halosolutus amylolyticus]|uniref:HalOD1 output domain-containing protein n=1 Tax=Halosolutus amylolyticus TaxID=2932267 RepID=A0ABD5PR87_9EURY|nr:HalOD1 output domain-containing protein [Halosolutus amylolyticus]
MTSPPDSVESLEYDPDAETYRVAYDTATTSASRAVLAALDSIAPERLQRGGPLYDALDPDALDRILAPPRDDETAAERSVRFTYLGFRITAFSEGYLEIHSIRDGENEARSR